MSEDTGKNKSSSKMRIGDYLVKEGFVKKIDVIKALDIQQKEVKEAKLPLGRMLLNKDIISEEQLLRLLKHPCLRKNIGTMAVQKGLLDKKQLADCLKKKRANEMIGEVLIKKEYISVEDLENFLYQQLGAIQFGELALNYELVTQEELDTALTAQKNPRTIGEILCDMKVINPADLNYVLRKFGKQLKFGEILIKKKILDEQTLNKSLQEQRYGEEPLGKMLVRKKNITIDQLYTVLSTQYNMPYKKIDGFSINESQKKILTSIVGQKYAEKNLIIAIDIKKNDLTLAVFDPANLEALHDLKGVYSHLAMTCVFVTEKGFLDLFENLYGISFLRLKSDQEVEKVKHIEQIQIKLGEELGEADDKSAIYGTSQMEAEEVVNYIIKYGITHGASDIHIEQDREGPQLRYRIDGMLNLLKLKWLDEKLPEIIRSVISRIKVISNLDITEKRIPQDGVFRVDYYDTEKKENVNLDFRVATCPAIIGENVNIRILDSRMAKVGMESLNHSETVLKPFKKFLKSSAGMVLVSGPTGSGKSSTLYAALQYLYNPNIKIITAEDPIEYSFAGIMQTQVNPKINLTFARLLRSFFRLDPDVILVGEIRDDETATISFDAAQTGHLILSTLHTNDSVGAVTRLLDLNIEYNQIASCIMGVIAQRLLRKICPSCLKNHIPTEDEWEPLFKKNPVHLKFFKGEGCKDCNFTGYKGRILISELFEVDRDIARALNRETDESGIKQLALEKGMQTMIDDGLLKLNQTTLSEILRVVPNEMIKEFKSR